MSAKIDSKSYTARWCMVATAVWLNGIKYKLQIERKIADRYLHNDICNIDLSNRKILKLKTWIMHTNTYIFCTKNASPLAQICTITYKQLSECARLVCNASFGIKRIVSPLPQFKGTQRKWDMALKQSRDNSIRASDIVSPRFINFRFLPWN